VKKLLFATAITVALAGTARAEPAPYELQSRCGNDAAVFFARQKQKWEDADRAYGEIPSTSYDYENNYSPSMKGCFVLISSHWSSKMNGYYYEGRGYHLYDVSAHRLIGYFSK
jgi:hypothetical protein